MVPPGTQPIPEPPASPNRSSILGWVKNLKRLALTLSDLVNTLLDTEGERSPVRTHYAPPESHELLRPVLNRKLRSANNIHRRRLDSAGPSMDLLRQHRDLFLQHRDLFLQHAPDGNSQYFGVPLEVAISQALVKISIMALDPLQAGMPHYGRIPIVVAKCGVFLKKHGMAVEGIFRVGGLSKRIRELQTIFNTPPEFGRKLDWDGYNVHDAASVLRRYLNALPEPLVPLELYEEFRDPLRLRQRVIKFMKYRAEHPKPREKRKVQRLEETVSKAAIAEAVAEEPASAEIEPSVPKIVTDLPREDPLVADLLHAAPLTPLAPLAPEVAVDAPPDVASPAAQLADAPASDSSRKTYKKLATDVYAAIDDYKHLLDELPCLQRQLLFYILDLLSMVQNNSNENLMSARNLAAIFQPSILLHPNHDMDPHEYALSQLVVEFLIQYAYKLLPNDQVLPPKSPEPETLLSSEKTPNRTHSKSLSNPNNEYLDMIGYHTVKSARGLTVSDTEHDFNSASSDDELVLQLSYLLPKPSAPANLMGIIQPDSPTRH